MFLFHPLVRTSKVFPSGLNTVLTAWAASALPSERKSVVRTWMVEPGARERSEELTGRQQRTVRVVTHRERGVARGRGGDSGQGERKQRR